MAGRVTLKLLTTGRSYTRCISTTLSGYKRRGAELAGGELHLYVNPWPPLTALSQTTRVIRRPSYTLARLFRLMLYLWNVLASYEVWWILMHGFSCPRHPTYLLSLNASCRRFAQPSHRMFVTCCILWGIIFSDGAADCFVVGGDGISCSGMMSGGLSSPPSPPPFFTQGFLRSCCATITQKMCVAMAFSSEIYLLLMWHPRHKHNRHE